MRAISAAQEAVLSAPGATRASHLRVKVKDSGGTLRDLSTYAGHDFVLGATYGEKVDDNGLFADIRLQRAVHQWSLSPLDDTSGLNKQLDPAASPAALLWVGRELVLEAAASAVGQAPTWMEVFRGYVDNLKFSGEEVVVSCRGLEARLMKASLRRERVYAYAQGVNATKGCYLFETDTAYALNDLVLPSQAKQNGHFYKCTTAGTTASTEPTWNTGGGSTTSSGSAVFTEVGATSTSAGTAIETVLQQLIDDNLGASVVTLYVPASPGWNIKYFKPDRQQLWEILTKLVEQLGWFLRYRWRATSGQFELTLWGPPRSAVAADRAFAESQVLEYQNAEIDIAAIRNIVQVVYSDSGDLDAKGVPKRKKVVREDSASKTKYGDLFFEAAESSSSNIDTATEANNFGDAMLADLKEPGMDATALVLFFAFAELGDLYQLDPAPGRWSSAQKLAVVGYEHTIDEEEGVTRLFLRGQPSAGSLRWLRKDGNLAVDEVHQFGMLDIGGTVTLTAADVVGGTQLRINSGAVAKYARDHAEFEVHLSKTSNFVPSSSTLVGITRDALTLADLDPGVTYYKKAVPLSRNGGRILRGLPTAETSFVAGYLKANHVLPYLDFRRYPLNGDFESPGQNNAAPHVWVADTGTFATDWDVHNANPFSGSMALELKATAVATSLRSGLVQVNEGHRFRLDFAVSKIGTPASGRTLTAAISWLDFEQSGISSTTTVVDLNALPAGWQSKAVDATPPSGARWARVSLTKSAHTDARCYVDGVELVDMGEVWKDVASSGSTDPYFKNSWVNYNTSTHQKAAVRKDRAGRVWLKGLVANGTVGSSFPIFTLPSGYRPPRNANFAVVTSGGYGRLEVDTSGNVYLISGGNGYVALDQVSFETWE